MSEFFVLKEGSGFPSPWYPYKRREDIPKNLTVVTAKEMEEIKKPQTFDPYPEKPFVIATIPHYDDRMNITKCYTKELTDVCDLVLVFYGRVKNYPALTEEQEEKEMLKIKEMLDRLDVMYIIMEAPEPIDNKIEMVQELYNHALGQVRSLHEGKLKEKRKRTTPVWFLRIDSDEQITPKLAEELLILTRLDYLYTIFLKERHFVDSQHIIVGSGGWDIKGNKFIPRLFKVWDGRDIMRPMIPHHHSTTDCYIERLQTTLPYASMANIISSEVLLHWGHAKSKKEMKRKGNFYKKRGDMIETSDDNYVPVDLHDEKRLRVYYKNKNFEGITKSLRGQKI